MRDLNLPISLLRDYVSFCSEKLASEFSGFHSWIEDNFLIIEILVLSFVLSDCKAQSDPSDFLRKGQRSLLNPSMKLNPEVAWRGRDGPYK